MRTCGCPRAGGWGDTGYNPCGGGRMKQRTTPQLPTAITAPAEGDTGTGKGTGMHITYYQDAKCEPKRHDNGCWGGTTRGGARPQLPIRVCTPTECCARTGEGTGVIPTQMNNHKRDTSRHGDDSRGAAAGG